MGVAVEAVANHGHGLDGRRFWRAKRGGATTAEALARLGYPQATVTAASARWGERVESDDWLERDRALPGVRRALRELRGRGAQIIVVTARRRAEGARRSLDAADLTALVDELVVVDPFDAAAQKARELRRTRAALFVGDAASDGAAARAAGVPFVAVTTGQRSARYLRERGYEAVDSLAAALRAAAILGSSSE